MSHLLRKKLQQEKEDYVAKSFSKEQARREIAREEEVEEAILDILKTEYDSIEEGRFSLPPDILFGDARGRIPDLTLKEFTDALNRLSGDGLFRSRKRIGINFCPNHHDWTRDSRRKPKVEVDVHFLRLK